MLRGSQEAFNHHCQPKTSLDVSNVEKALQCHQTHVGTIKDLTLENQFLL